MSKNKKGIGMILAVLAGILALVAALLYGGVMYRYQPVYYYLGATVVLAVVALVLSAKLPKLAGYLPIIMAALLASAAVWGTQLMVNQLGYVVAGLDGMDTIMSYIYFVVCAALGMIVSIVASFLPMAKAAE